METCLETPPASNQRKHLITPANARELQRAAVQARLHNQLAKKIAENSAAQAFLNEPRIALVERELARVSKMMSQTDDPGDYCKLAQARKALFTEWQVLSGTPNPGARRTGKRERAPVIQPEPVAETPQAALGLPVSPANGTQ